MKLEGQLRAYGTAALVVVLICGSSVSCRRRDSEVHGPSPAPAVVSVSSAEKPVRDTTPPGPGAIVFSLRYRGLGPEDFDLSGGGAAGWGSTGPDNVRYLKRLKKRYNIKSIHNPVLTGFEWCGLEMDGDKVVALHLDLNRNEKPDEGERILPAEMPKGSRRFANGTTFFFTPDMRIRNSMGIEALTRLMLRIDGGEDRFPMWSSASIWMGSGEIDGTPYELMLLGQGVSGGFTEFGRASLTLYPRTEEKGQRRRYQQLSRIMRQGDRFMRVRFLGDEGHPEDFRLVMEPYEGATGTLRTHVVDRDEKELPSRLTFISLKGEDDDGVVFNQEVKQAAVEVPSMRYEMSAGNLKYGANETNLAWECTLSHCRGIEVEENAERDLVLGPVSLTVVAVDADRRYAPDVKPATRFSVAQSIYLSPVVTGPRGTAFARFAKRMPGQRESTTLTPGLKITSSDGTVVHASQLEYG